MKRFRFKLEDFARSLAWYHDYYLFRLKNPFLKKIPKNIRNILIIDLKFIGDLIIDTPLIRALKLHYPHSKISILVPEGMEEVLYKNPNLEKIYISQSQMKEHFDLGILLYPGDKSMCTFLRKVASFRIGIRRSGLTEPKGYYLHRKTKPIFKLKHKIEDNLDVLKTIGIETNDKHLELYLKNTIPKYKDYIAITPVSKSHPTLPPEKFAILGDRLIEKYRKKIIFTCTEKEKSLVEKIISLMKNKKHTSIATGVLQEYFSIIKNAFVVVCIDTSAQHIAAALKVPVVSIFSAGDKKIWRPYSSNSIAIQNDKVCISCMKSYCTLKGKRYLECVNSIQIDYILNQVEYLVGSLTPAQ